MPALFAARPTCIRRLVALLPSLKSRLGDLPNACQSRLNQVNNHQNRAKVETRLEPGGLNHPGAWPVPTRPHLKSGTDNNLPMNSPSRSTDLPSK